MQRRGEGVRSAEPLAHSWCMKHGARVGTDPGISKSVTLGLSDCCRVGSYSHWAGGGDLEPQQGRARWRRQCLRHRVSLRTVTPCAPRLSSVCAASLDADSGAPTAPGLHFFRGQTTSHFSKARAAIPHDQRGHQGEANDAHTAAMCPPGSPVTTGAAGT